MENKNLLTASLPNKPGCYLMKDIKDEIIYIGKAKNIKKRVLQYFTNQINPKTRALVNKIEKIDYIITNTDKEAFLLENNLIKKHKPFYNIKLIDDKTYPYLVITDKINARLNIVHKLPKKYYKAYGPFPRSKYARDIYTYLNHIYPFIKCKHIPNQKCIYYDIGECPAPCITKKDYDYTDYIKDVDNFLNNKDIKIIKELELKRDKAKEILDYENAKRYHDLILASKHLSQRQIIDDNKEFDADYIGYYNNADKITIFILQKRDGSIKNQYHASFDYLLNSFEAINSYLNLYYENQFGVDIIYLPEELQEYIEIENRKIVFPKIGEHKKILEMSKSNAKDQFEKDENISRLKLAKSKNLVKELEDFLGFYPKEIDAIDISQLFGTNHVGCVIRFLDLKVQPKMFRSYILEDFQDDYKATYDVVMKRFKNGEYIDLIIADGGLGQVNSVKKALSDLGLNYNVLGLTKNNKHSLEKIYYNDKYHEIDKKSELFRFFLYISDKVHNYAINKFRKRHLKNYKLSKLENVKGLGEKRKKILLQNFKSYEEMLKAPNSKYKELGIPESVVKALREELENADNL